MKISSLILAKSQSKRLPNKNTLNYHGKQMFLWNMQKCIDVFGECHVSSDTDKILNLAYKNGGKVIKRGEDLCGDVPNIPVYQHAMKMMDCDVLVAVQACSPDLDAGLLEMTKEIMMSGCPELMTCYSLEGNTHYHEQNFPIYGSIWAMTRERLENYGDPYHPKPAVLLIDDSKDIHYKKDL